MAKQKKASVRPRPKPIQPLRSRGIKPVDFEAITLEDTKEWKQEYADNSDNWDTEVIRLSAGDPGLTRQELEQKFGRSTSATIRRIRQGIKEGRYVEGVGYRLNAAGMTKPIPVYSVIVPEQKPKTRGKK